MWTALAFAASLAPGPQPIVHPRYVVVVDAGHGGDNPGCLAFDGRTPEKDVAMALARHVVTAIEAVLPHAEVHLTRDDDDAMPLAARVQWANALDADLFLSLHANASPDHTQSGFETYVLDARSSSHEAAWTARRENDDVALEPAAVVNEPLLMTLQLERTAQRESALRFAAALQRAQAERFPTRSDRGIRQAPFDVLMGTRMPAVLFEAGFLDHPEEGHWLLRPEAQREIAEGIAEAVVVHYREAHQLRPRSSPPRG